MQATIEAPNKGKREYSISDINRHYLESFQQAKYPQVATDSKQRLSYNQYRSTLQNFLQSLGKDAAMVKREDIDAFLSNTNNGKNKAAHIKSFMIYLITENVKNCQSKIGRDLLVKLIEM